MSEMAQTRETAERGAERPARLTVVLATDTYGTIRPVIAALRAQAVADEIEVVIALPADGRRGVDSGELGSFAAVRLVDAATPLSIPAARAAGIRAATAPIVFIGETHTYPRPGWAEALLGAFERPWTAVVPAIGNANPQSVASWAAYLSDYGPWGEGRPAGEIDAPLLYNTAYRRAALLDVGEHLEHALEPGSEMLWPVLQARGHRAWFEPAARIDHVNVAGLRTYIGERLCAGILVGAGRAARWPVWRRALYVLVSPLIPPLLVGRLVAAIRRAASTNRLPRGTLVTIVAGAIVKAAGEVIGYAGRDPSSADARMTEIELHKVRYAARPAP